MQLIDIINKGCVYGNLVIDSKKKLLEFISSHLLEPNEASSYQALFDCFIAREKLGSTGLGHGVALPHVHLDDIDTPRCLIAHLKQRISYDANDGLPVDIVFALVVPRIENELHLHLLSTCAKMLSNEATRKKIRQCDDDTSLYQLITDTLQSEQHHE